MRDVLHWLPASQRITYTNAALIWRCLTVCAPSKLCALCQTTSDVDSRRALHFLSRGGSRSLGPAPCSNSVKLSRWYETPFGISSNLRYVYCFGIISLRSINLSYVSFL